ncbi:MAG TPA: GumC family protein, partial [Devosiaceae bacterium]|nr:GumC family protein [Devosiaceae bacterium]
MSLSGPASYEDLRIDMRSLAVALWRRKLRIVLVSVLLCIGAWFYLSTLAPQYEATASLLIEARDNSYTRAVNEPVTIGGGADDASVQSQIQLVQSRETLLLVIQAEGLRGVAELNRPPVGLLGRGPGSTAAFVSDEALVEAMRDRIVVARERDSRVISVGFRAEDPALAARVANALATAHVQRRGDLLVEDTSDATVWLLREIEGLRARVSQAESKVANYRVDNDLFSGNDNSSLLQQQMSDVTAQISAAAERRGTVVTKARLIRGLLEAGQPVETIVDVRESPVVQQLAEQKAGLQAQRAERAATLLSGHPSVRALDAQIAELTATIQAEGRRIAQAFDSQAEIESGLEQSLRDELTRLKLLASLAQINGVTLAELEREAAAERDLLNAFLIRYREAAARSSNNAALPDVRIVSTAAEPGQPVYPQKNLLLAAVGMVSVVLQAGAVVLAELAGGSVFVPRGRREDQETEFREPEDRQAGKPEPGAAAAGKSGAAEDAAEYAGNDAGNDAVDDEVDGAGKLDEATGWPASPVFEDHREADGDSNGAGAEPWAAAPDTDGDDFEFETSGVNAPSAPHREPQTGPIGDLAALAGGKAQSAASVAEHLWSTPGGGGAPEAVSAEEALASKAHVELEDEKTDPESNAMDTIETAISEFPDAGDDPDLLFEDTDLPFGADIPGIDESATPKPPGVEASPVSDRNEQDIDVEWDETSGGAPSSPSSPGRGSHFGKSTGHIAMHIAANGQRLSLVAAADESREDRMVAGRIALDLVDRGLSVALIDAGGPGGELDGPGLTDLAADLADFGEVVHHVVEAGLYYVP